MKKIVYSLLIISFAFLNSSAQEVLNGLYSNPAYTAEKIQEYSYLKQLKNQSAIQLPFIDDFTEDGIFPSLNKWEDNLVFINDNYPDMPPTFGVATFDALNDSGNLYYFAQAYPFIADQLSSKPIRLDSVFGSTDRPITIADSLYFSFYYQPDGIGNAPEAEDSLYLEFYSPFDSSWHWIWSDYGQSMNDFENMYGTKFRLVMIPLTDSVLYFHPGFQFRFSNYASIANNNIPSWSGNVDQWHLDYVYLNIDRSINDTVFNDVAFAKKAPSMLKDYQSVPARQFIPSMVKSSLDILLTNLDEVIKNTSYIYQILDENGSPVTTDYDGGNSNLDPYFQSGYQTYAPHSNPPVSYTFPNVANDSVVYTIQHIFKETGGDMLAQNDTTRFEQTFYNYYAYDDGNPEAGYGLSLANAKLAYEFTLNQADTLRAVQMFFNRVYNNANQKYFKLMVWSSLNPETVIYESELMKPQFEDELNAFHTYPIEDSNLIVNGTIYIGWKQSTGDNLNLGYDLNNNSQSKIFYNIGSGWNNSMYSGSLMIRPVLGWSIPFAGIEEKDPQKLAIYPNPTHNGIFHLNTDIIETENITIEIFDISGKQVMAMPYSPEINASTLDNGLYIIRMNNGSSQQFGKLLIHK